MDQAKLIEIINAERTTLEKLDKQRHGSIEIAKYLNQKYDLESFGAFEIYKTWMMQKLKKIK